MNTGDRYAVEAALQLREGGTLDVDEVIAATMGPESADRALRRALAMGCDRGLHLCDPALAGSDAVTTGAALATLLRRERPGLVLLGERSSDGGSGVMAAIVAEYLGAAVVTGARSLEVVGGQLVCRQLTELGLLTIAVDAVGPDLPAVVSVNADANTPRYASLKQTMEARARPVTVLSCAELGIEPSTVGSAGAALACGEWHPPVAREPGTVVEPDSVDDAVELIIEWLEGLEAA